MNPGPRKEGRIERVVRMVMGKDHIGDLLRRLDQLLQRIQDRGRFRHHSRINDHPKIAIAHKANRASSAVPHIARKENLEFGSHAPPIVRIVQVRSLRIDQLTSLTDSE